MSTSVLCESNWQRKRCDCFVMPTLFLLSNEAGEEDNSIAKGVIE